MAITQTTVIREVLGARSVGIRDEGNHENINAFGSRSNGFCDRAILLHGFERWRRWPCDHSVGVGLQIHLGFVDRQEGGAKRMTLRQLTLTFRLLAVLLILAADLKVGCHNRSFRWRRKTKKINTPV